MYPMLVVVFITLLKVFLTEPVSGRKLPIMNPQYLHLEVPHASYLNLLFTSLSTQGGYWPQF